MASEPQNGPFATPQSHSRPRKARPCDGSVERRRLPLPSGSTLTAPSLVRLAGPRERLPLTSLGKTPCTKAAPANKRKRLGSTRQNEATPELPKKGDHYSLQTASTSFFSLSMPPFLCRKPARFTAAHFLQSINRHISKQTTFSQPRETDLPGHTHCPLISWKRKLAINVRRQLPTVWFPCNQRCLEYASVLPNAKENLMKVGMCRGLLI